jgi:hypothetical protein
METQNKANVRTIAQVELETSRTLGPELKSHLLVNSDVYNFIGSVLEAVPRTKLRDVTQARKVATCLLIRVLNDLRCIGLVSVRGYPEQACALATSVYEASFTALAIGDDEAMAQEWIDHSNPNQPFKPIYDLTLMGMKRSGIAKPENQARRWYISYSQLCMAKHLNPLLQGSRGFQVSKDQVAAVTGPDASQASVRLAWFALEKSAGFALTAGGLFGQMYVSKKDLAARSGELHNALDKLVAAAVARGWDKNPYPKHWKIRTVAP